MTRTFLCFFIILGPLGCITDVEEPVESESPPLFCDVESTRERTTTTDRAGTVNFCSAAWVETTDNIECVTPSECSGLGLVCMKEAGDLSEQCVQPCGGGQICPEGMYCRDCEDAEPYCANSRECPRPHVRRYDAEGYECPSGQSVVVLPDPADVSSICTQYGFNSVCDITCWDSAQCCNTQQGNEMACISEQLHFNALNEHNLRQHCETVCDSASDCGTSGSDGYCCMSYDSDDDEYKTTALLGQSSSTRVCWPRGIYDFCPELGSSGGGGIDECARCREVCRDQGSWCQCDDECS